MKSEGFDQTFMYNFFSKRQRRGNKTLALSSRRIKALAHVLPYTDQKSNKRYEEEANAMLAPESITRRAVLTHFQHYFISEYLSKE